jgi:Rps23 Pro-64 3,4-dihydroxylase Tpa1-like proline 4-hydroxylase
MNTSEISYEIIAPSVFKFTSNIDSQSWIELIEKTASSSYSFEKVVRRPHLTMELPALFNKNDDINAVKLRSMFFEKVLPAISKYMEINRVSGMFPKKTFITVSKLLPGSSMVPHRDNFDKSSNHFICMMYINDNFSGGELNLIDINLKYKPVAGDIIIYKGNVEHEVLEASGLRYSIGYGLTDIV